MEEDNTTIQKGDNDSAWDITIFSYSDLQRATSDFSDKNLLNQSNSGKVYRGEIWGIDVAVKLLPISDDADQVKVFRLEVDILRRLNHPHLVSVIGACPQKCAIVYEFMSGGTLEARLSRKDLAWKDRVRIANEICSALAFLHSRKPDMVIGDLKPENILLDANDRIKLTCQFMHRSKTDPLYKSGYLDPIYVQSRKLEPNVDIYSFGMILLHLLTNKLSGCSLTVEVTEAWENKYLNDVLDNAAKWPYHVAEELSVLALRCCEASDVALRPDASEISEKLKQIKLKESTDGQLLSKQAIEHMKWDDVTTFSYSDLKKATSDFSDSNELGEGGFGKVYKGNLWGTEVAIKILISKGDPHQVKAFSHEVDVLRRVNHPHLVPLMGACPEEFALVYQFIPGGTLEDRLSRNNFIWKDRIGIATQICSALVFLHSLKPECVVHGDLKPANILLDANGKGMLGDFGICRRIPVTDTGTKTHLTVTAIQGSDGYLDPVYKQNKTLAPYVDIYAFGMLLLRLLTNQKPESHLIIYDVEYAMKDNKLKDILDKEAKWPDEVANELSKLALNCCFYRAKLRPRSSEVLDKLNQRLHEATKMPALPEKESGNLRKVRQAERFSWAAARGVNEEELLEKLTEDIQREIRQPFFKFLKNARIFTLINEPILGAIFEKLRQKSYIRGSVVLYKGDPIDKMIFIVRGKMDSITIDWSLAPLSEGDVCGAELLTWCVEHSSVKKDGGKGRSYGRLFSTRTVKCVTNVEALEIEAADLEEVTSAYARSLWKARVAIRYESPYWRNMAATHIQVAWRYRQRRLKRYETPGHGSSRSSTPFNRNHFT